mmetsp:Transcript_1534/g.2093  ORF Transcript_1534/g.2093 Transcript_1534/m.2093 type:complete len:141 (-) Transcript_1534:374-796(-)|eukprot:CAMPEP_0178916944 /NCGR_PEP_ID=MMETSP0786-20121207/12953_1 /TAXON_ID=186022 /ORGANISM="Thalassionema frauenfeldii, Strain CCMP 1798" /LENGTH=140 /DNA_ID=CAMNT_0020590401 /DNA_START=66 /DNA_END=488 /DNA_ORIENTATION=-
MYPLEEPLLTRYLQGGDVSGAPVSDAPVALPVEETTFAPTSRKKHPHRNPPSLAPEKKEIVTAQPMTMEMGRKYEVAGFIVVTLGVVGFIYGIYSLVSCWKQRRERRMMELVNTQADTVLGDMCMIPTAYGEEEEDNELL